MKIKFAYLFIVLFLWNCKNDERITFEPIEFTSENCTNCPKVTIHIPKALDESPISATINNSLQEEVISMLIYDDEIEATNIEEAIQSFKNGYLELKKIYPDEPVGWEADIEGKVTYEDKNILTIQVNSYSFTGGAHGFSSTRFLNFDKAKGLELENMELFKDSLEFQNFVEGKFRAQEKIPATGSVNATGFMFEDDEFHLPQNIGFTQEGLQLFYEQYEVASYADGPIILTLSYKEIKPYLKLKIES
ncbi:DUF3298 and DUF4163 domain-containing protein [Arenibacter sp. BSSL-BM3]|uniref:DUF3298 and DUF4163 domain-containing protein n=1 Tax=Arenibacter arenosicollis TaxID=2762274 RepID=A0ABR7QHQ2_9FLAO|nr:DUF3298 and DUF4163 domain-containing protein [Arenibacter arenosicollis]MBC8766659.1 DUF3298 and DUF4163 domain-containing protein [Arenibacter arenosicollis]